MGQVTLLDREQHLSELQAVTEGQQSLYDKHLEEERKKAQHQSHEGEAQISGLLAAMNAKERALYSKVEDLHAEARQAKEAEEAAVTRYRAPHLPPTGGLTLNPTRLGETIIT